MYREQARPVDLFNLLGWTVQAVTQEKEGSRYCITALIDAEATPCPLCAATTMPYRYGYREKLLLDLPFHMNPVHLLALRRRYRCRECSRTFLDELPGVEPRYEATQRLVQYIQVASLYPRRTFATLAHDLGVSETFVRTVFLDHIAQRERTYEIATPQYLGVDEIVIGTPWFVAADLEHRCLIDMLEKRTLEYVAAWFTRLPCSETIQILVIVI